MKRSMKRSKANIQGGRSVGMPPATISLLCRKEAQLLKGRKKAMRHHQLSTKLTTCRAMACPAASPVKLWSAPSTSMRRLLGTRDAHSSES